MKGVEIRSIFQSTDRSKGQQFRSLDIHEKESYDELINKCEEQADYLNAFRYQYLKTLRYLHQKKYIQWREDRTNHDFIRMISNSTLRQQFRGIAQAFDYYFYGEFPISKESYFTERKVIKSILESEEGDR